MYGAKVRSLREDIIKLLFSGAMTKKEERREVVFVNKKQLKFWTELSGY